MGHLVQMSACSNLKLGFFVQALSRKEGFYVCKRGIGESY